MCMGNYIEIWTYLVKVDNFLKFWCWINSCLPYFIDLFLQVSFVLVWLLQDFDIPVYHNILSLIFMIFKMWYWQYWRHFDKTLIDLFCKNKLISAMSKLMWDPMRSLFHLKHVTDSMFIGDLSRQRLSH